MSDIRRICEHPTEEDKQWFPDIAGADWLKTLHFAMRNFKDESFIVQYLSPKLIRDFHFFAILDDDSKKTLSVSAIHDEAGYRSIRQQLAGQYNLGNREPNIQVWSVDLQGDRALTLRHNQYLRRPLNNQTTEVLKHVARLWGFDVYLETVDSNNQIIATQECKLEKRKGRRGWCVMTFTIVIWKIESFYQFFWNFELSRNFKWPKDFRLYPSHKQKKLAFGCLVII